MKKSKDKEIPKLHHQQEETNAIGFLSTYRPTKLDKFKTLLGRKQNG